MTEAIKDLENQLRNTALVLGFLPHREFLEQIPYGKRLVAQIDCDALYGFDALRDSLASSMQGNEAVVPLPSLEQRLVGATIAQKKRVMLLDAPGTRKSIAALSAVVPISNYPLQDAHLKTCVISPGYVLPEWKLQIEHLFVDPHTVVITKDNRQRAISQAADPRTDFVLLGYDMTFRPVNRINGGVEHEAADRYIELLDQLGSEREAYTRLASLVGNQRAERIKQKRPGFDKLVSIIIGEEYRAQAAREAATVIEELRSLVFLPGQPYYVVIDEFHNLVGANSRRGQVIRSLAKPADYLAMLSGTGIGNTVEGLAYAAELLGFVPQSEDFVHFVRSGNVKKVRAFLDLYATKPIRDLHDIDPLVPEPVELESSYHLSEAEMDLMVELMNADEFYGFEKGLLIRYAIANPQKMLPEGFEHLNEGDESLHARVLEFYQSRPGMEERVRSAPKSRMLHVRSLVEEIKARGEKAHIVCEYQRGVTEDLEHMLKDLGIARIDQDVSADLRQIRLTSEETRTLVAAQVDGKLVATGSEVYRSDLSSTARQVLGIENHEVYGLSDRQIQILEVKLDPDSGGIVATRLLREGVELREIKNVIIFEDTLVPFKHTQTIAREVRTNQRDEVKIYRVIGEEVREVEDWIRKVRVEYKEASINAVFRGPDASPEDLRRWARGERELEARALRGIVALNSRTYLVYMFNRLEGVGSVAFADAMRLHNNAQFLAKHYNYRWDQTFSGKVADLTRDIICGIETRTGVSLDRILDAGAGSLAVSRAMLKKSSGESLERRIGSVDLNRFQMEYGVDAIEDATGVLAQCYVGDITDFSRLVPFSDATVKVFDHQAGYRSTHAVEDSSQNLVVASLVVYLLDREGRYKFLNEAYRVLDENGYLIIVNTPDRIHESSREQFIKDVESMGFTSDAYFTGTYKGQQVRNVDTDEELQHHRLEAYVTVFRRNSARDQPIVPPELRLKPEYDIVEGGGSGNKQVMPPPKKNRYIACSHFTKIESGLDLRYVERAPSYVPLPDVGSQIRDIVATEDPKTIEDVLDSISDALRPQGEQHG